MSALQLEEIERKKRDRQRRLQTSLESMLPQLEELGALKAILFGSLADGTAGSGSDLDILVIMPPERIGREWARLIYQRMDRDVATDILVFNTIEFEKEIQVNAFLRKVMESGRLVFERDS